MSVEDKFDQSLGRSMIDWDEIQCTPQHIEIYKDIKSEVVRAESYIRGIVSYAAHSVAKIRVKEFNDGSADEDELEFSIDGDMIRVIGKGYESHGDYAYDEISFPVSYLYDHEKLLKLETEAKKASDQAALEARTAAALKKENAYKEHRLKLYEELKKELGK